MFFRRGKQQADQAQITATGTPDRHRRHGRDGHDAAGGWYQRLTGDSAPQRAEHQRPARQGRCASRSRTHITAADANKADFGTGTGAYTIPSGNLFPLVAGAPQAKTRAEVYAMGFRNPFRIQVDENDVAYISDYSPDASTPQRSRGPAGTGRFEIVRKPSNYGWPTCYKRDLAVLRVELPRVRARHHHGGHAAADTPAHRSCTTATARRSATTRCGTSRAARRSSRASRDVPPVTNPDIWYSYSDNNTRRTPLGTPCLGYYAPTPGPIAPGSTTECPRLFPELYTGGVGPHGMTKYNYDPANPNPKKFPPYYDDDGDLRRVDAGHAA